MSRIHSPDISSMLAAPDKRIREASGLLSRLYRLTLIELGIRGWTWNHLLNIYLEKISQEKEMTHDMISNERSNLRKGLNEIDMTFPMFRRGIEFFIPQGAEFYVDLVLDGDIHVHATIPLLEDVPNTTLGPLTYLYRSILNMLGKDVHHLNPEIDTYLSNPLVRAEIKGKKRGNDKGNLRRELTVEDMTWEVFKKGLRVLSPAKSEIGIIIKWGRRKTTKHTLVIPTPRVG